MRRARNTLACLTLALASWMLVEGALLLREARLITEESRQHIFEASYLVNENLLYARGTLTELREAAAEWNKASKRSQETSERVNRILGEAEMTIASTRAMIEKTDANLNAALLPEATNDLRLLGESLEHLRGTSEVVRALAADPENGEVRARAIALLKQAEETLAAVEKVGVETQKVPPVARKALWVQILSTVAITLKVLLGG